MKKTLTVCLLAVVLALGAVLLAACDPDKLPEGSVYYPDSSGGGTGQSPAASASNSALIGYSAASSVSALAVLGSGGAATASAETYALDPDYKVMFEEEFLKQLAVIGSFIDRSGMSVTQGASQKEGYDHTLTVTTLLPGGGETAFVLDYKLTEHTGGSHAYDDEFDLDEERNFGLDGVMSYDGATYAVTGKLETETEKNETERELELLAVGEGCCILLSYGSEKEPGESEEEFEYAFYNSERPVGAPVEEYSIELGNEDGKEETEVAFISRADGGNWSDIAVEYEAETLASGTVRLIIELKDLTDLTARRSARAVATASEEGGEFVFTFAAEDNWNAFGEKIFGSAV